MMKNSQKFLGYHAFASRGYRLLWCAAIPLGLLLLQGVLLAVWQVSLTASITVFLAGYFVLADICVFGGSCAKQSSWMEYLKSSVRGADLLRGALVMDCLVRFAVTAVVISLSVAEEWYFLVIRSDYGMLAGEAILWTLQKIFAAYAMSSLCILICRHSTQNIWYLLGSYLAMFPISLILIFCGKGAPLVLTVMSCFACSILFSVMTVNKVMNKMRRSYYDKTVEI